MNYSVFPIIPHTELTLIVCAADYCAAFCSPSVPLSAYLNTVGEKLNAAIDILWTGDIITGVSQNICITQHLFNISCPFIG